MLVLEFIFRALPHIFGQIRSSPLQKMARTPIWSQAQYDILSALNILLAVYAMALWPSICSSQVTAQSSAKPRAYICPFSMAYSGVSLLWLDRRKIFHHVILHTLGLYTVWNFKSSITLEFMEILHSGSGGKWWDPSSVALSDIFCVHST